MYKQVILVRKDLKLSKGKMAAQVAHAALNAYKKALKSNKEWVKKWESEGEKKVVLGVSNLEELLGLYHKVELPKALITDAGHTELPPGTVTCAGFGPAPEEELDKYFGHLKLM